jgi:hypothetical protein
MKSGLWLVSVIFVPTLMLAQSDRGTLTGTVADPAGALVPNASLSLKNIETGAVYEARTTETGNYTLAELPAGNYVLTVAAAGFRNFVQSGIQIQVSTVSRLDVKLQLGSASETVTVPPPRRC